ncbi:MULTISPECIES: 3'-5' exonuclease [Salegentibacter]|mgnify:FL=1|jgi:DNA polymerase-3 subunit epsilon|uniref:DNA polymerase-3 subunit epsilon n=1 Tax=Salegentibacter agarivorans TaxID=345907 RepID=A0A1I2PS67_9FLAO|nr:MULTISPECIES: 3'-5' exonuclease [Salegentibacter]APS39958.1 DNA polymerase III subunit epsilon [Salegentibacter sp. T436]SFG18982.1 DNA polymerase-3 subunit epsilon [Salegentibacter agarivorans]|tara:strand:- start:221 stop:883 length:663 start_codon:yes stop_codon:yes gene_type:complete
MLDFLKKKPDNLPDFWKDYEAKFQEKLPEEISETRFVVFDTETTGFDIKKDRMLSIGAVGIENKSINIADGFEEYILQETFNPKTVKIHGIIQNERIKTLSEEEAVKAFLKYIGNSVLVAHHAGFDVGVVNEALSRMGLPRLKNKVLDTVNLYRGTRIISNLINREKSYSLDEIAETYNIDTKDRHTAAGDAFITALAFLTILGKLNTDRKLNLKKLFRI